MHLPPDINRMLTALADGGPVAQGVVVGGILLAMVALFANRGPSDRVTAWVLAFLPTTLVCSAPVVASWATMATVQRSIERFVRATHAARLTATLDTLAGLSIAGSVSLALVAAAGALMSGLACAVRGTSATPLHALVPTVLLGGVATAFPDHHVVVLAAIVNMTALLLGSLRHPTRSAARWQTMLHTFLLATAVVGIEHTLRSLSATPSAVSLTPAWSLVAATGIGAGWTLVAGERVSRTHLLVAVAGAALCLAVGWLLQTPYRAHTALLPETQRVAVRERLGVLSNRNVMPPRARATAALDDRPVLLVRSDVLMVNDDVLAYLSDTTPSQRATALGALPHNIAVAIDEDATWSSHAPLWKALAVERIAVDAVVRCTAAVLCTIPIHLDTNGMRVPDDMLWSEVVERHGGNDGLAVALTQHN